MASVPFIRGVRAASWAALLTVAAVTPALAGGVYFVKDGDTLSEVARLFRTDVERLSDLNHLGGSEIRVGQKLRIPDPAPRPVITQAPQAPASTPASAPATRRHDADAERVQQALCREETVYHTVAAGDTLFAISRRYGTDVGDLLRLNGLKRRSRLAIGQKILVRRSGPRTHTVAAGDTLYRLARRYHVPESDLVRLNHLDGAALDLGQRLLVEPCDPYAAAGAVPPPLGGPATAPQSADGALAVGAPTAAATDVVPVAAEGVTERVIKLARTMLDIPYRFGGTTMRGIDCSGYVQRVFAMIDLQLPRTAREQYAIGARIDRDELAVGDLVFFRTYASFPSHVGIYLGDNLFIHASSVVRKVTIDSIDLPYYRKRFLGARRLVVDDERALAAAP
jgi:cell wall-associated NlpC family hydrolase